MNTDTESVTIPSKSAEPTESKRIDFVLVVHKDIKKTKLRPLVTHFIHKLQELGVEIEASLGVERNFEMLVQFPENIYVKIHLPRKTLEHFANIYDVDIGSQGHSYIPLSDINLTLAQTPLTADQDIFKRAGEATNVERILITNEILSNTKFGYGETRIGVQKLIRLKAIKEAFPLHDDTYFYDESTPDSFLNDRQLLLKYWSNFTFWYKEQPLNLIAKYYGSEVAFYFAWLGFYNQMLIPAALVGILCFSFSVLSSQLWNQEIVQDICTSNLTMCPLCHHAHSCILKPLKNACYFAKVSALFDNSATVFFAVFMSFWATIFLALWKRLEIVLMMRWNVEFAEDNTKIRLQYKEAAKQRQLSRVTGQMELYIPARKRAFKLTLSYATSLLLLAMVLLIVAGVILYRVTMASLIRMSNSDVLKMHSTALIVTTSGILQVICIKIFGKFYGPASEWLTQLENPRTQSEFDNSVIHKRYFLGFANNYASLFYIAFLKGRLYTPAHRPSVTSLRSDVCHICGCLTALCIQLFFLMLLKSMAGNILTLIVPMITKIFKKKLKKTEIQTLPQWEEEFTLERAGRYLLTTEFMEMIIQYGFVTFFVAAFPLAPLCALVNNCMEMRLDALKLVTRYRRPIPRQTAGIGAWNDILVAITHLSTATNAFVLAFTSDFVPRQIYKFSHKNSLMGYIKSTLSVYNMEDSEDDMGPLNSTLCHYRALRYPPAHPKKYQFTPDYWYEIGIKLVCVIIFEHVIMLTNALVGYFIPDLPQKVTDTIQHEKDQMLENRLRLGERLKGRKKVSKKRSVTQIEEKS